MHPPPCPNTPPTPSLPHPPSLPKHSSYPLHAPPSLPKHSSYPLPPQTLLLPPPSLTPPPCPNTPPTPSLPHPPSLPKHSSYPLHAPPSLPKHSSYPLPPSPPLPAQTLLLPPSRTPLPAQTLLLPPPSLTLTPGSWGVCQGRRSVWAGMCEGGSEGVGGVVSLCALTLTPSPPCCSFQRYIQMPSCCSLLPPSCRLRLTGHCSLFPRDSLKAWLPRVSTGEGLEGWDDGRKGLGADRAQ